VTAESDPKVALGLFLIVGSTIGAIAIIELVRPSPPPPAISREAPGELLPSELDRAIPTGGAIVPGSVLDTAETRAEPWAPGLSLVDTMMHGPWEERRATIKDSVTGDVRAYAIGDLLPHGSLLVGVSTGAAEVMVADRTLVRLTSDGRVALVEDFRTADEGQALRVVADRDAPYRSALLDTLALARSEDPAIAQQAVDALIDGGEPVVEVLIGRVDSLLPLPGIELAFPSGDGRRLAPRTEGDLIIGILERLTTQTFGDIGDPRLDEPKRQEIRRAWLRWWGISVNDETP
jgi:hypothetical protein